ncbi:MAG: hypothetical protein ACE5JX_18230, partial [Acidobacteriota bacterium]
MSKDRVVGWKPLLVTGLCLCLTLRVSAQIGTEEPLLSRGASESSGHKESTDPSTASPLAGSRPNIMLVMVDDLGELALDVALDNGLLPEINGFDPDGPAVLLEVYKDLFRHRIRPAERHESYLPLVEEVATQLFDGANPLRPSFNERFLFDKSPEMQEKLEPLKESDVKELVEQFAGRVVSLMAVDDLVGYLVERLTLQDEINNTIILLTCPIMGGRMVSIGCPAKERCMRSPLEYPSMPVFPAICR